MAENGNGGEFSFGNGDARNGLTKIATNKKDGNGAVCHDDSATPVKAQTIDELHSLQKKRSAPTTPIKSSAAASPGGFANAVSEEERQKQQLQSIRKSEVEPLEWVPRARRYGRWMGWAEEELVMIRASLASLTRETGPKVVRGDPATARKAETPKVAHVTHTHPHFTPTIAVSDSALKFTHFLYNLSPAELYEQAIKDEKGSFITSSGALATLSGAKTGRSPRDKRVVKDDTTEAELWWGKGSPNIEMDEHTFLTNRERAVDYLNSLDK
ncbi:hypothetical protein CRG98_037516, partial [Punica granatum]